MKLRDLLLVLAIMFSTSAIADEDTATLWVFRGMVKENGSVNSDYKTHGFQVEQETPTSHGNWDLGYLNEGSLHGRKRDGLYGLLKFPYQFSTNLETSIAAGPYLSATTVETSTISSSYNYGISLMTALSLRYRVSQRVALQARYGHVAISSDHRDTDQLFLGVGYSFFE